MTAAEILDASIDQLSAKAVPPVAQVLRFFKCSHLPPHLRDVSQSIGTLAFNLVDVGGLEGPELTVGLRKLLEAKDCFVRAALPPVKAVRS